MAVVTAAVSAAVEAVTGAPLPDVPSMTWADAMERYGSDKPDVRFGMELTDLGRRRAPAPSSRRSTPTRSRASACPGGGDASRSTLDGLVDRAKQLGAAGLVWMRVRDGGVLESPVAKFLSESEQAGDRRRARRGTRRPRADRGRRPPHARTPCSVTLRLDLGRPPVSEGGLVPLWVVDFPLFEAIADDGRPIPAHHPFTQPHPDDLDLLDATGDDAARRALAGLRHGAQRVGARIRQRPDPPARDAAAHLRAHRHGRDRGAGAVRVPARRVQATARRPTPASRSASTASSRSSPGKRASAR